MKNKIIAIPLFLLLFAACTKDDTPHNYGTAGPYTSLDNIYSSLAPVAKSTTLSVSSGGSMRANGGTRFVFPPNAFVTASGAAVTGSVDITVNDWLKKGDMIFGKVLPISNGNSLESGGQAFVNVSQNGKPVFLKNGANMLINLPQFDRIVPGMQFFRGQPVIGAANNVNWFGVFDSVKAGIIYGTDTISILPDSLGYCNADKFMSSPNYQEFTVQATSTDGNPEAVVAFALYDQYKGLWPLGTLQQGPNNASHVPDIPVHLVAFGLKDGNFYGGVLSVTPKNGGAYTINLTKTDPAAFRQMLNGL